MGRPPETITDVRLKLKNERRRVTEYKFGAQLLRTKLLSYEDRVTELQDEVDRKSDELLKKQDIIEYQKNDCIKNMKEIAALCEANEALERETKSVKQMLTKRADVEIKSYRNAYALIAVFISGLTFIIGLTW